MILSDRDIAREIAKGELVVSPIESRQIQPASIDLRLGPGFRELDAAQVDPFAKVDFTRVVALDHGVLLRSGQFLLATTVERVRIPPYLVGVVDGKSSLARLGLKVHFTAGYIDPGFEGQITLELETHTDIFLRVGMDICQIRFHTLQTECELPYGSEARGSRYQDQDGATPSRYWRDRTVNVS